MSTPQRIQRRRAKGYNMQAESMALNGLPAVSCTRPGRWGNPFTLKDYTIDTSLALFEKSINYNYPYKLAIKEHLAGKNLACFCRLSERCHCDILLKIANS